LFSFEIPLVTTGNAYTLPVSLDITGDDVFLEQINANYGVVVVDSDPPVSSGPTGFLTIAAADARSNVVVTGASYSNPAPPEPRGPDNTGTWGWEIKCAPGTTANMAFDMNIQPGLE
jgi:hypothetical protein